jgi:hypothetical protein
MKAQETASQKSARERDPVRRPGMVAALPRFLRC